MVKKETTEQVRNSKVKKPIEDVKEELIEKTEDDNDESANI
jgi:hypothetical protein